MPPGWLGAGHTVTPPQGMVDSGKLFLDACAVMTTVITKQLAPGLPIRPSPAGPQPENKQQQQVKSSLVMEPLH